MWPFKKRNKVADAMAVVCDALRNDPDYAWSWQCNVAMPFVDQGGSRLDANRAAANFLYNLAQVRMWAHPHYMELTRRLSESETNG